MGKFTWRINQGETERLRAYWRGPLIDLATGDPILDAEGVVQPGPPVSLTGYTGRSHIRSTIAAASTMLELTSANNGILIPQPLSFMLRYVTVATTADIVLAGFQTIDGVLVTEFDRVLVKDQNNAAQNGVYTPASGAWTRTEGDDTPLALGQGATAWVRSGTQNADTVWRQANVITAFTEDQLWELRTDIGQFEVVATAAQTATLTSSGVYDVELVSAGGEVKRILEGKMRLSKEVTRT